jgi:hypothetical protein
MLGAVHSVTCPRCGTTFDTAAITNTRCRRCRYVVNIGRQPRSSPSTVGASTPSPSAPGLTSAPASFDDETPGGSPVLVGAALTGAGALAIWHGWHLGSAEGQDPEALRRVRLAWCGAGALLLVLGVALVAVSLRSP